MSQQGKVNNKFQRRVVYLFVASWLVSGFFRTSTRSVLGADTQWDLKSHVTAAKRVLDYPPEFDAGFVSRAYMPPYLPIAFPFLDRFAQLPWATTQLIWVAISLAMLAAILCFILSQLPGEPGRDWIWIILLVILFKGTFLAVSAGQFSLWVTFFLVLFLLTENHLELTAAFFLALTTMKPNLALPFFIYLLFRGKIKLFVLAAALSLVLNLLLSFSYLGPAGHSELILSSGKSLLQLFENDPVRMGNSGRVDLAPFLAIFGLGTRTIQILQALMMISGMMMIYRNRHRLSPPGILLLLNLLVFATMYHRDYDLLLLLAIALPVIWPIRGHLHWLHIAGLFPLALPLHAIFRTGMDLFPGLAPLWHAAGTSTVLIYPATALFLLASVNLRDGFSGAVR